MTAGPIQFPESIHKQTFMKMLFFVTLAFAFVLTVNCHGPLRSIFPKEDLHMIENGIDPGEPLFLSPYLEKGEIAKAKELSLVNSLPLSPGIKSYSGFLTVNPKYQSNMFFWFFPAQVNPLTAPVLLWLQGGPGGTSLFGLFVESGPIQVTKDIKLMHREKTWAKKFNMLYIDNPVMTGFSFTKDDRGMATNETDVGRDLYSAVVQFFKIFKEYDQCDFYVTGESYAGKYVPALAYTIHNNNQVSSYKVNLKGIAIGDGLCDPVTMTDYSDFMYQTGLVDEMQRDYVKSQTDLMVSYIQQGKYIAAFTVFDKLLNGDISKAPSYFTNVTGSTFYFNYLLSKAPDAFGYYNTLLQDPSIRKAIHVGNLTFNSGEKVEKFLLNDVMQSVKPWIAVIMNNYKTMIYSGQLDIIIAYPLTEAFLRTIPWKYQNEYLKAERHIWKINPTDPEVAGYVRKVNNFYQVMVRGAGHILPFDQPDRGMDMMDRFVNDKSFS